MSKGHSLEPCFLLHHGQNISNDCSTSTCFYLTCKTSNYVVRVPKMSFLKFYKKITNFFLGDTPSSNVANSHDGHSYSQSSSCTTV
jgi:hypothetical protein